MTQTKFTAPAHAQFGVLGEVTVGTAESMAEYRRGAHRTSKYEGGWCKDCKERAANCQCTREAWFGECGP